MLAIGLNLSSSVINIVELTKSRKNLVIGKVARAEVPSDSIIKGEIQKPDILAGSLKEIWRKYRISDRKVYIGIANQKVIAKEIKIPVLNDAEIKSSIQYQISDFIPIPKNNITYDYYVVEKGEDHSRLMLVGAMKSMIDDVVYSFKNAGLLAQVIDLNCFALYRTVNHIYGLENNGKNTKNKKGDTVCVVNLGTEMSIIEMIQDYNLKYPRFTSTSTRSFVDEIYKETKKDTKYCEDILSEFDFNALMAPKKSAAAKKAESMEDKGKTKSETDKKTGKKADEKSNKKSGEDDDIKFVIEDKNLMDTVKKTADHFIEEIGLSIEHFMQENPKSRIEKIIFTGEYIKNIDKYLEQEIQHKVELLNIADSFTLKNPKVVSDFGGRDLNYILDPLAIGMALRGLNL
jgi:type IV pilus assembly protein PilM